MQELRTDLPLLRTAQNSPSPGSGQGRGSQQPLPQPGQCLGSGGRPSAPEPGSLHPPALLQNFLYKCIGTTLGAASHKEVVRKHLQELLETARYQEETEREGAVTFPTGWLTAVPTVLSDT